MNRIAVIFAVLFLAAVSVAQAAPPQFAPKGPKAPAAKPKASPTGPVYVNSKTPAELQLAGMQEGVVRAATDTVLVRDYAVQLDTLHGASGNSRVWISNVAIYVHDQLQKRGIDEPYLSILQHVNQAIPADGRSGRHVARIFSDYLALRITCMGPDQATSTIQHWLMMSETRLPKLPN